MAALAHAPSTNPARSTSAKLRTNRYQPYNEATSRTNDENTRNIRLSSSQRRAKVGGGNQASLDQKFTISPDTRGLSTCAICLSHNPHDVAQCDASLLWDGHTPVFARKGDKGAKLRTASTGDTLCLDWNLPRSCNSGSHISRHRCSGCGNNDHGAQSCRLAQPKVQN